MLIANTNAPIFPTLPGQAWPIIRTPGWQTRRQYSLGGKVTSTSDWSFPRYTWELVHAFLRQGTVSGISWLEMQQLMAFYNAAHGPQASFLYQDQDDNSVTVQSLGQADGTSLSYVLLRTLGSFVERIYAPNFSQPITVYLNGVAQAANTYTITPWGTLNALGPGVIIFNTAPVALTPITITYSYYWACRFAKERCNFEKFLSGYYKVEGLSFRSLVAP